MKDDLKYHYKLKAYRDDKCYLEQNENILQMA